MMASVGAVGVLAEIVYGLEYSVRQIFWRVGLAPTADQLTQYGFKVVHLAAAATRVKVGTNFRLPLAVDKPVHIPVEVIDRWLTSHRWHMTRKPLW